VLLAECTTRIKRIPEHPVDYTQVRSFVLRQLDQKSTAAYEHAVVAELIPFQQNAIPVLLRVTDQLDCHFIKSDSASMNQAYAEPAISHVMTETMAFRSARTLAGTDNSSRSAD